MIENSPSEGIPGVYCKVCACSSEYFGESRILKKYRVTYFHCAACGFIQTETPYWLEEAYSSAIAAQDTGVLQRNLLNCELTSAILKSFYPRVTKALDFGGGHGIFVRLMRDRGFPFVWHDRYASNDYARVFEHKDGDTYEFLTAFEVLEHLDDPVSELSAMMALSSNVLVSTCLLPNPAPKLSDWWYYVPSAGQHVSFYSLKSLQLLAGRFKKVLLSHGPYHLFAATKKSELLFSLLTNSAVASILNKLWKRPSLTQSDFELMTK